MESLKIVNKKINYCEEQKVPCVSMRLVSLQQIKEDLEVLEIIKNKLVDVNILKMLLIGFPLEHVLEMYNQDHFKITMEELLKLKQWLEVNE